MAYTPPLANSVNFSLSLYTVPNGNAVDFSLDVPLPPPFPLGWCVSKKLGKPGVPDPLNVYGIWQMRMTKRGKVPIKMKFYTPTNPQTELQQANRQKFADAMASWQTLTSEEKQVYNTRARKIDMFGRNLFIRDYYSSN